MRTMGMPVREWQSTLWSGSPFNTSCAWRTCCHSNSFSVVLTDALRTRGGGAGAGGSAAGAAAGVVAGGASVGAVAGATAAGVAAGGSAVGASAGAAGRLRCRCGWPGRRLRSGSGAWSRAGGSGGRCSSSSVSNVDRRLDGGRRGGGRRRRRDGRRCVAGRDGRLRCGSSEALQLQEAAAVAAH